ncbi:MAG: cellulase family glycosylhydrolase [Chthoniobacteraceae bacterium]
MWLHCGALAQIKGDPAPKAAPALEWVKVSGDGTHFVGEASGKRVVFWGVNYDRDDAGRLLEDYWKDEWETVVADFHEMRALGANVVRIHLQLGKFMDGPDQPNSANLAKLGEVVKLAESIGLYLDVTGLGCYDKAAVPGWYSALDEAQRWAVQGRFWAAVAGMCRESPAVFCYNLMNEPVLTGGNQKEDWLPGEPLGGKHYVQRITTDARGRSDKEIARQWVESLTKAIRAVDSRHLITVGVIPWAQIFKGAKPLFHSPEVGGSLDFVSVHFYPKAGALEESLAALKVYEVGKPLVIEEIFPMGAGIPETEEFIRKSRSHVDGWLSFYWGKGSEEQERKGDIAGKLTGEWLERFEAMGSEIKGD